MDKQSLELLLAQGESIEGIAKRFGKDPSTVSYWVAKHGLRSPYAEKHAAKGGLEKERLEVLVEGGMTIAEIAAQVGLSKGTVRHWMRVHGFRTARARGERMMVARAAKNAGLLTVTMSCRSHGDTEFVLEGRGYYRCKQCRTESVVRHRQKVKAILVEEAGGRCAVCGYSRHLQALQFHHLDPKRKRLGLSSFGVTHSLARLREEAKKCVLLCGNCHVEVEIGAASLPDTVRTEPPDA
ncbi:MAG TPA: helix-turn-helix domain-containing protein [Solirubrobacteraceae bacterium]|nr:helix-turn-helix domain-containing protein [Solirubrobacteraceae bacterium]